MRKSTVTEDIFQIRGDRPAARIQKVLQREAAKTPRDLDEEELAVWRATNEERARIGKAPVTLADVQLVHQMAIGHTDYVAKFPIYCENIVLNWS